MNLTQRQIGIVLIAVVVLGGLGYLLFRGLGSSSRPPDVKLTIWGIEPEVSFRDAIQNYETLNPNVKITYERIDAGPYNERVLDALASNEGPDILMLHNRSLPKDKEKLAPVPNDKTMSLARLRDLFPTVVEDDFVDADRRIYALPTFIDTLSLLYNRDYFDSAGITGPPATWKDLQDFVPFLRVLNSQGQVLRAGAAIGGSEQSVKSAVDIVNLLMMQNGAQMTDRAFTQATFATENGGKAAIQALEYYLQFVNAGSPYYTWNDNQGYSVDAFAQGKSAMALGYEADVESIRRKSPFLNFKISYAPQPTSGTLSLAYADYWGLAVSKQARFPDWAWDFIVFFTTNPDRMKPYLDATRRPPALRTMIAERFEDADYSVFARQALAARSWYEADETKIQDIFNRMIQSLLRGETDARKGLGQAQDAVTQLMKQR